MACAIMLNRTGFVKAPHKSRKVQSQRHQHPRSRPTQHPGRSRPPGRQHPGREAMAMNYGEAVTIENNGFARECLWWALSKPHMSTIQSLVGRRVSSSAVSIALLICSAVWWVGACTYFATSASKNDWSATPLSWMLIVMVTPAMCFAHGMILADARKHSRFSRLEWCALATAFLPVTLGTLLAVWAVKVLFSMSGVGI
jgi:hypothetical protein